MSTNQERARARQHVERDAPRPAERLQVAIQMVEALKL